MEVYRLMGYRLVYLFVGHGKKIVKFPCSRCPLWQSDKPITPPNRISNFCYAITFAWFIVLHFSAHLRQTSAQHLQCSMCLCFSHSVAHASQISAHSFKICSACSDPLAKNAVASWHISAQSSSNLIHFANIFTSCSFKQATVQWLHSAAQAFSALISSIFFSWLIFLVWRFVVFKYVVKMNTHWRKSVTHFPEKLHDSHICIKPISNSEPAGRAAKSGKKKIVWNIILVQTCLLPLQFTSILPIQQGLSQLNQ